MKVRLAGMHIISLIGQQGAGKTTVGEKLSEKLDRQFIEASKVVTEITGVSLRDNMPLTNEKTASEPAWLADGIIAKIVANISRDVVLSGVREWQVHKFLTLYGAKVDVLALWCPTNERFARVVKNDKVKTYSDFMSHGESELNIGLRNMLSSNIPTFTTTYYSVDETVDEIIFYLDKCKSPT